MTVAAAGATAYRIRSNRRRSLVTLFDNVGHDDPRYTQRGGVYVPAGEGPARWFGADLYTMKLRANQTNGAIGFVEAWVPPGGGSVAHTHHKQSETFYLVSGELEFLDGDTTFAGHAGDIFFVPPNTRHRFVNTVLEPAKLLFFYTPAGGSEEVFLEHGDEPQRGVHQEPWGEERFNEAVMESFRRSGTVFLP